MAAFARDALCARALDQQIVLFSDVLAVAERRDVEDFSERLGNIRRAVADDGVPQLVRDDARQLVLAVGERDEFAREQDVTAGNVEGVGFGKVYKVKLES